MGLRLICLFLAMAGTLCAQTSSLTLKTVPPGLPLTVDGATGGHGARGDYTVTNGAGAAPTLTRTVAAQAGGGTVLRAIFQNTNPPVRVMPLGDSITHGGEGYASWRYPLWQSLSVAGANVDFTGSLDTVYGAQPSTVD